MGVSRVFPGNKEGQTLVASDSVAIHPIGAGCIAAGSAAALAWHLSLSWHLSLLAMLELHINGCEAISLEETDGSLADLFC